jgi:predicted GTPase
VWLFEKLGPYLRRKRGDVLVSLHGDRHKTDEQKGKNVRSSLLRRGAMADIVELIESATDDGLSEDEVLREIDDLISKKVDTNHVTSDLRTPLTSAIAHKFPKVQI